MAAELLVAWLNEAHSVELAQAEAVERYIADFADYPDIRGELRQHSVEIKDQINDLKEAIEDLGGKTTQTSSTLSEVIGTLQETSSSPYHDELVKDLEILHTTKHYEHIMYMAIAEAARHISEDDIADMCERMADEEQAMAEWTEEQLPVIVTNCMEAAIKEE